MLLDARFALLDGTPHLKDGKLAYPITLHEQQIKGTIIALVEVIEKHVRQMFERMPDTVTIEGQETTKAQAIQDMTQSMKDMKNAIANELAVNSDYFSGYLLVDDNDTVTLWIEEWALTKTGSRVLDSFVDKD